MLLQHKKELGLKHVTEVLVFRDELKMIADQPAVQIVFRIEDVPPPEPEKPGKVGECRMYKGRRECQFVM
jgi:hypothetical protein